MTPPKNSRRSSSTDPDQGIINRVYPSAPELEDAVIGALMLESSAFPIIENILTTPDIFSQLDNRILFTAIQQMYYANEPIDMLTVVQKIISLGKLKEVGSHVGICRKIDKVATSAHIEFHSRVIQQKWMQRQVMLQSLKTYANASDNTQDIDDVISELNTSIYNIQSVTFNGQYPPLSDIIVATNTTIESNMTRGGELLGISSGLTALDKITLGFQNTDFIVIAARPAMGKTALLGTLSKNIAADQQIGCAVFSLEMSSQQLMMRYFSLTSGIDFRNIQCGNFSQSQFKAYDQSIQTMLNSKLIIDDTAALSVEELSGKLKHLVRTQNIKIAFIDYLQLMTVRNSKFSTRQEEVSFISKSLKALAKQLNIPIIALSQLNRDIDSKAAEGARPKLSHLRESGAIEQDTDLVCFIHRPEYYGVKTETTNGTTIDWTNKAELIIAKHRNGATGNITLRFNGNITKFTDEQSSNPF